MQDDFCEKTLDRDGCTVHYWTSRENSGPWLIFLHGAGADHRMFNDQIPVLSEKYQVLFWDARGQGLSRPMGKDFSLKLLAEDLRNIMQKENIGKATFIGQSMGGNTAQEVAFLYPDLVESLVLVDCTCNTMKLSRIEKLLLKITPFCLFLFPWRTLVEQCAVASSIKQEVRSYLKESFNTVGKKDFCKIFLKIAACLHYEENYRVNKPMMLVYGELDNTGNIRKIASSWANGEAECELHMIKGASHCANQDNPEVFNQLLVDFLGKRYGEK